MFCIWVVFFNIKMTNGVWVELFSSSKCLQNIDDFGLKDNIIVDCFFLYYQNYDIRVIHFKINNCSKC